MYCIYLYAYIYIYIYFIYIYMYLFVYVYSYLYLYLYICDLLHVFTLLPGHQATPLLFQLFSQASNTTETSCFKEPEAHLSVRLLSFLSRQTCFLYTVVNTYTTWKKKRRYSTFKKKQGGHTFFVEVVFIVFLFFFEVFLVNTLPKWSMTPNMDMKDRKPKIAPWGAPGSRHNSTAILLHRGGYHILSWVETILSEVDAEKKSPGKPTRWGWVVEIL